MTRGKTPVAMGSSVPVCPMRDTFSARRAIATTSCDVGPSVLSTTSTPSTARACMRLRRLLAGQQRLVIAQFVDRFLDVRQRPVRGAFGRRLDAGIPVLHENLERAHVDDAVVQEAVERGHV